MVTLRRTAVVHLGTTLLAIGTLAVCLPQRARAEPTVEQAVYWWQDEIREASFAVSRAQTGRAAQWPQMCVPAGAATLPLGRATGPIEADGRLEEEAWQHATRFPIGPVFDAWRAGRVGRPDAIQSTVEFVPPVVPTSGFGTARMLITLQDWRRRRIDVPIRSLAVAHAPESAGISKIAEINSNGDGTFTVLLTTGVGHGTDRFAVTVDYGARPVVLMPNPSLRYSAQPDP